MPQFNTGVLWELFSVKITCKLIVLLYTRQMDSQQYCYRTLSEMLLACIKGNISFINHFAHILRMLIKRKIFILCYCYHAIIWDLLVPL